MLRTEYPFALIGWPRRILAVLLGEGFLGFLAIVAVGLALFPMLFTVKPTVDATIDLAQWAIIGWFAVEFVFAFAFARSKRAFMTNPWRWLDLVTIAVPLASLLPTMSRALRSSPVLRLARIGRLVSLGVRATGWTTRHRARRGTETITRGPGQVTLVSTSPQPDPEPATMDELLRWLHAPDEQWFHVSNPSPDELKAIAATAKLPPGFLETHLLSTSYPHWASAGGRTGVFLWMPEFDAEGKADRHGMFFLPAGKGLLSLSRRNTHAIERLKPQAGAAPSDLELPFVARMMAHALERVVHENERLAGQCEEQLRGLEEVPVRNSQPEFFEKTFRLKKELSAAQADLWRLKGITGDLANGRVALARMPEGAAEVFRRYSSDVDYLYDTLVNIREEVLSVIELHLNVVSFEMNRVMRVLAVVSCLGLIPAVVGGLFGMNLVDNPWPFTLPQVAFAIFFAMVLLLYLFFVKGWLR
jgi:Mg2+ and Co2+ transporter CorA